MNIEELKLRISSGPLKRHEEKLMALVKPSLLIKAEPRSRVAYKCSKFGGSPDFPDELKWPISRNGQPFTFIAQLNMRELEGLLESEGLPFLDGVLYLFFGLHAGGDELDELGHGFLPVSILYQCDSSLTRHVRERPESPNVRNRGLITQAFSFFGLADSPIDRPYKDCAVSFERTVSIPVADSGSLQDTALSKVELEDYAKLWEWLEKENISKNLMGSLLGYVCPIQNEDMDIECYLRSIGRKEYPKKIDQEMQAGAAEWTLLMQLEAMGNECEMYWGDGMVYVWCKKSDLLKSDFSNCKAILQTT